MSLFEIYHASESAGVNHSGLAMCFVLLFSQTCALCGCFRLSLTAPLPTYVLCLVYYAPGFHGPEKRIREGGFGGLSVALLLKNIDISKVYGYNQIFSCSHMGRAVWGAHWPAHRPKYCLNFEAFGFNFQAFRYSGTHGKYKPASYQCCRSHCQQFSTVGSGENAKISALDMLNSDNNSGLNGLFGS
jgi:hypothetical protein